MTNAPASDVIVVGGGVIGCAAAYSLAGEGLSVLLLERGELASEASGVAAGMLSPIGEALQGGALFRHGLAALANFPELCERLRDLSGIDPEFERSGVLRVAMNDRELESLRALEARLASSHRQIEVEWQDGAQARGLAPGLADAALAALWSPGEAHVRSPLFTLAFAGAARALGARLQSGVSVRGLLRDGDAVTGVRTSAGDFSAGFVLLCCGSWAAELTSEISGFAALPVAPVRGQILSLDAPKPPLRTIVWAGDTYVVPKRDGSVLVGATEEPVGFDKRVTAAGVSELLTAAARLVPTLGDAAFREAQVGLRPGSPDGLPAIASAPGLRGLAIAAGHFRNGILLAQTTGRLLSEIVLGKADREVLADFDPQRWRPSRD